MIAAAVLVGALFLFVGQRFAGPKVAADLDESQIPVSIAGDSEDSTSASPGGAAETPAQVTNEKLSQLSPGEQKQWQVFQEILKSRNDNDPRLDKELSQLSVELHQLLKEKYSQLPAESRNERGLITFLVARDLKGAEDLEFLKAVYEEAPCLSLENCGVRSNSDPHLSGIDQNSMNYPQLAALYQLEKQLDKNPTFFQDSAIKDRLRALLTQAKQFGVPVVRTKAEEVASKFNF